MVLADRIKCVDWMARNADFATRAPPRTVGDVRSTLGNLPESPETMPVASALKSVLETGVRLLRLDAQALGRPCPPRLAHSDLAPDGGNLPWVVKRLRDEHRGNFDSWLKRVRDAVPGLKDIEVAERAEDRHAYVVLRYEDGLAVPSRLESEGVLRLLGPQPASAPAGSGSGPHGRGTRERRASDVAERRRGLADRDPWLTAPGDDLFRGAGRRCKAGAGHLLCAKCGGCGRGGEGE